MAFFILLINLGMLGFLWALATLEIGRCKIPAGTSKLYKHFQGNSPLDCYCCYI